MPPGSSPIRSEATPTVRAPDPVGREVVPRPYRTARSIRVFALLDARGGNMKRRTVLVPLLASALVATGIGAITMAQAAGPA